MGIRVQRNARRTPNGIDGVIVYYALAKAGLVRVPLNARETASEHAYKIDDGQARALICAGDPPAQTEIMINADELPALIAAAPSGPCEVRRDPDEPLRLAYTGGTTGKPKAVVLTTRSELAEVSNFLVDLLPNLHPGSVMLHAAPITHGSGAFFLPHLVKGAPNVILPRFSPQAWLEAARQHRATSTFMVPTMIAMLLEEPADTAGGLALERLCYGGAPIAPAVLRRGLDRFGPVFTQLYGQAEAPLAITCLQPWEHTGDRLASAGSRTHSSRCRCATPPAACCCPGSRRRRAGRGADPRAAHHGPVLAPPRGHRAGPGAGRLAAHRRHRPLGQGRRPVPARPAARRDHQRRLQRLPP